MISLELTQEEADRLFALEKHAVSDIAQPFPVLQGGKFEAKLLSDDKKEDFLLDVYRGRINLKKITYQNRARKVTVLIRLDLSGSPHQNPDGEIVECPHVHYYKQGYGDKWASAIPTDIFKATDDIFATLDEFMDYCSIKTKPNIPASLFANIT